eukprot:TRINITY_DN5408_c0_g1_i1.p1 TRINITY_DN5408_c0_g1~~TRINITY_DN5408_c0_g1_i1.p1  ORF type:complete len:275 (+),score=63.76 TRINITY_DN5408_c0_g1_i1:8-832(+)
MASEAVQAKGVGGTQRSLLQKQLEKAQQERDKLQLMVAERKQHDVVMALQLRVRELERSQAQLSMDGSLHTGYLAGTPDDSLAHYVISLDDCASLSTRIKKLQTELWNLEVSQQNLLETHANCGKDGVSLHEFTNIKEQLVSEQAAHISLQRKFQNSMDELRPLESILAEFDEQGEPLSSTSPFTAIAELKKLLESAKSSHKQSILVHQRSAPVIRVKDKSEKGEEKEKEKKAATDPVRRMSTHGSKRASRHGDEKKSRKTEKKERKSRVITSQ